MTKTADLQKLFDTAQDAFGGLDILWNNAGHGGTPTGVEELDEDGFDQTVSLLLKSVFVGTKLAVPMMKEKGGSIINTSSISAVCAGYAPVTYSVCKKGVAHFSKLAAAELSKYKIRVNAILPGFIATSIFGSSLGLSREQADQMAALTDAFAPRHTLALGDAPNDIEMLQAADFGVIVANPHRDPLPPLPGEDIGRITRTTLPGPAGWNGAVLDLIARLNLT